MAIDKDGKYYSVSSKIASEANKIIKRYKEQNNKDKLISMRLTEEQYNLIESQMKKFNFASISEYLRFAALNIKIEFKTVNKE